MAQQARPANVAALPLAGFPTTPGRPPASAPLAVPVASGVPPGAGPAVTAASAAAAAAAAAAVRASTANPAVGVPAVSRAPAVAAVAVAPPPPMPVPAPPQQQQTVIGVDVQVPAGVLDDGAALFTRVPLQLHELTDVRPAPAPPPAPVPPRVPAGGGGGTPSAMSVVSMAPSAAPTARPPALVRPPTPASVAAAAAAAVAAAAAATTTRAGGPLSAGVTAASSTTTTTSGGLVSAGPPSGVGGGGLSSGATGTVPGGATVPPRLSLRDFRNSATSLAACGLPARLTEEALESVIDRAKGMSIGTGLPPEEGARHVTVWHKVEGRKIAGNAAPLRRNLYRYLERHPECEVYLEQDKLLDANGGVDPLTGESLTTFHEEHVPIWHTLEARKVTGNAAPLKKNLAAYLAKHKHCEVYDGQDKALKAAQQQAAAAAAATAAGGGAGGHGIGMGMGTGGFGSSGAGSTSTPSSSSAVSELPAGLGPSAGGGGIGVGGVGRSGGVGTSGLGVDGMDGGGVDEDGVYGAGTVASPASMLLLSGGSSGNGAPTGGSGGVGGSGGGYQPGLNDGEAEDEDDGGVVVAGTHSGLAHHTSPFPPVQVVQVDAFGEPTHHVRLGSGGPDADIDGVVSGGPAGVSTGDEVGGGGGRRRGSIDGSGAGDSGMEPNLLISSSAQAEEMAQAGVKHSAPDGFGSGVSGGALPGAGSSAVPIFVRTSGVPSSATAAAAAAATAGGDLTWYELSSSWSNMPAWRAAAATGAHAVAMGIGGSADGGAAVDGVGGSAAGGVSGSVGVAGVGRIPIPGRLGVGNTGTHHHGVGLGGGGLLSGSGGIMSGSVGDGGHLRDDFMLSGAGVGSFGGGAMSVTLGNTPGEVAMLLGGGHTPVGCSIDLDHAVGGGEAGMDFSPSNFLSLYASPSERMLTLMQQRK
ncbi:hypothetical protein MMPV_010181 [Pyropia vietnamensis]